MGSFCASFGKSQQTDTTSSQQTSGQTLSNFAPQLQQAANTLQSTYGNLGSVGPNGYQYGAANAQQGVSGNLAQGYQTAAGVAQNGITPGSISQYMSPYIGNVVQAYNQQQDLNDAQTLGQLGSSAAKVGALTASTAPGAEALARSQLQSQRNLNTANLLNSGYGQAANLAQQNVNAQLQGANTLGSLVGANTGANAGLGSLGQNIFSSQLAPYTLANQYATGIAGLAGQAGSSYTGQSNGTQSQYAQQIPGAGTVAMGILGAGLSLLNKGGRVEGYANGGSVEDDSIMGRYSKAMAGLHTLHRSLGGEVGPTTLLDESDEEKNKKSSLLNFMKPQMQQGFAEGGEVEGPSYLGATDKGQSEGQWRPGEFLRSYLPGLNEGMWVGKDPTSTQRLGAALMNIGWDNPFAGAAKTTLEQANVERQRQLQRDMQAQQLAQQAAIAAGKVNVNGQSVPTLAAQKLPAEIAQLQAHSEGAQNRIMQNRSDYDAILKFNEQQRAEIQKVAEQEALGMLSKPEADAIRAAIQSQQPPRNPFPAPVQKGTWVPGQGVKMGQ